MRLLLIEDDPALAEVTRRFLVGDGHVVQIERDGVSGLLTGCQEEFDVIILDIMLPGLNGYDVLKKLREHRVWTPVIMLTAKDGEYDQEDAFDLGADDYLTKRSAWWCLAPGCGLWPGGEPNRVRWCSPPRI